MSCNCENQGFFKGDDLVDVITVNKPKNTDDLTITKAELQVGTLPVFVENNPVFPYPVSIMREKSVKLNNSNPIYLRITYNDTDGHEGIRTTCLGSLVLKANSQVVQDN